MNLECVLIVALRMCRCFVMVLADVLSVEAFGEVES